eukprot:GHRQ01029483.1.p1 GENE.GHRQ01029483.1~~GHRQ01029483.1.p1  ORF type:complete len:198 (+),score=28.14 GHRQ01029483.1:978-1571(+)
MVPEAAVKLAGAPECQSTEVTFTVLSAKARVPAGPLELTLPLLIKGGPAVLLTLRALLVVPEVVPNESVLEFGTVSTGHCKVSRRVDAVAKCSSWPGSCGAAPAGMHGALISRVDKSDSLLFCLSMVCDHRCTQCSCTIRARCLQSGASNVRQWIAPSCATGACLFRSQQTAALSQAPQSTSRSRSHQHSAGSCLTA